MSTVRADNFAKRDGSSSIPADTLLQGTAKAWLNLNGTGTIAARDSFNVGSVVDNGVGDYTANFAIALPNANYAPVGCVGDPAFVTSSGVIFPRFWSASSFRVNAYALAGSGVFDPGSLNVAAHGDPV